MASITCHSQIGIPMGIRRTFSRIQLLPQPIPASSGRHTLPLPWRLSFALLYRTEKALILAALGYEMLTVYVQNVNR